MYVSPARRIWRGDSKGDEEVGTIKPKTGMSGRYLIILVLSSLLAIAIAFAGSCTRGGNEAETLARAYDATCASESFRMRREGITKHCYSEGTMVRSEHRREGAKASPGRIWDKVWSRQIYVEPDGTEETLTEREDETIVWGNKVYGKVHDDEWEEVPEEKAWKRIILLGVDSWLVEEQARAWYDFYTSLIDPERLPDVEITGVMCLHFKGKGNIDKLLLARFPSPEVYFPSPEEEEWHRQSEIVIEVWLGKDDYLIRRITVDMCNATASSDAEPPPEGDGYHSTQIIEYYDYDQPIQINPPL